MMEFLECSDQETLAAKVTKTTTECLAQGLVGARIITLLVSGGRTPISIYTSLSNADLDWSRIRIVLSDDRLVPPDSPYSNERLVLETLLQNCGATAQYVRIKPGPIAAELLPFRVAILGMGDDGHIASLFPSGKSNGLLAQDLPRCIFEAPDPLPPEAPFPRLTLNLAAILESQEILLVLVGWAKRHLLEAAAKGEIDAEVPICKLMQQAKIPIKAFWTA